MSEYTMKHIIRGVVLTDTPKSNLMDWRDQLLNQGLATNLDWIFGHFLGPVCTWTTDGESGAGSAARTSPTPVNSSAAVSAVQPAASAANPADAEDEEAAAVIVNTAQQETVPAAGPGSSKKWAPEGLSMEDVKQRERQMVAYMRRHISPRIQLVTRANELLTPWEILEAVHQLLAPRDRGIIQAKLGAMYRLRQGSRPFSEWMQLVRKHAEDLRLHGHDCDEYMLKSVFVDGLEGQLYEIDQRHLRDYVLSDKRTVQHCHDHLVSVYGFRTARAITDGTCARKPKNSSPGALAADGGSRGGNRNSGRGSNSHRSYSAANSGIICYGCGQRGHRRAECPASHNQRAPQQLGMAAAGMGGRRGGPAMGRAPAGRPGMRRAPASRQPGAPAGTQCEYCRKPGHTQDVCYLRKSHQATRRAQGLAAHTRDFDDDSVFALMADTQPPETEPLDGGQEPGEQTEEEAEEMHVPEAPAGFRGFTPEQHMRQYQPYQRMTRACQQAHTMYEQLSASFESLMMELQDAREAHRAVRERLDEIHRRAQQAAEEQRISSLTEAEAALLSPTYSGQLAAEPAVVEMDSANGVPTAPGPPEVQEIDGVDSSELEAAMKREQRVQTEFTRVQGIITPELWWWRTDVPMVQPNPNSPELVPMLRPDNVSYNTWQNHQPGWRALIKRARYEGMTIKQCVSTMITRPQPRVRWSAPEPVMRMEFREDIDNLSRAKVCDGQDCPHMWDTADTQPLRMEYALMDPDGAVWDWHSMPRRARAQLVAQGCLSCEWRMMQMDSDDEESRDFWSATFPSEADSLDAWSAQAYGTHQEGWTHPQPQAYLADGSAKYKAGYDPSDYALLHHWFGFCEEQCGKFDIDICCHPDGSNAQPTQTFTADGLAADLRGMNVWCNPPFRKAGQFIDKINQAHAQDPTTSACIVLPYKPGAPWWGALAAWEPLFQFEVGEILFSVPDPATGGRKDAGPCPFSVVILALRPGHSPLQAATAAAAHSRLLPDFLIDSGATHHMTPSRALLSNYRERSSRDTQTVRVGSGEELPVLGVGDIMLASSTPDGEVRVCLTSVLHVPDLRFTLVSTGKLVAGGGDASMTYTKEGCTLVRGGKTLLRAVNRCDKFLLSGVRVLAGRPDSASAAAAVSAKTAQSAPASAEGGCKQGAADPIRPPADYIFGAASASAFSGSVSAGGERVMVASAAAAAATPAPYGTHTAAMIAHQRFGHQSLRRLVRMASRVDGMPVTAEQLRQQEQAGVMCHPCAHTKPLRAHRPAASAPAQEMMERLHLDIWGPVGKPTPQGHKYWLIFVEEYSRMAFIRLLRSRDEAQDQIKAVIRWLERQTREPLRGLRNDGARELISSSLEQWLERRGVQHEQTARYSPESNGMAERANRTIADMVRCAMKDSEAPLEFWGEAALYMAEVHNVSPAAGVATTPWEVFYGRRPNVSGFRRFGCLAFVHQPDSVRGPGKFAPRTITGAFVRYDLASRSYRVYSPDYRDGIILSRDVKCDDTALGFGHLAEEAGSDEEDYAAAGPQTPWEQHNHSSEQGQQVPWEFDDHSNEQQQPSSQTPSAPTPVQPYNGLPEQLDGPAGSGVHSWELPDPHEDSGSDGEQDGDQPQPQGRTLRPLRAQPGDYRTVARTGKVPPRMAPGSTSQQQQSEPDDGGHSASAGGALAAAGGGPEPRSLSEARRRPDAAQWIAAAEEEIAALMRNDTWELVTTPPGAKVLPCRWLFKVKLNADGSVERHKARLVVGGHRQQDGVDYALTFAPVGSLPTLRMLLAMTADLGWELVSVDISNAFLNGRLDVPVYMAQPEGYSTGQPGVSCRLLKSLYGLKQAPMEWFKTLSAALEELQLEPSPGDQALWRSRGNSPVYLLVWVDDILLAGQSAQQVHQLQQRILQRFKGRDLGPARSYLGMVIKRDPVKGELTISQPHHSANVVARLSLQAANPRALPLGVGADTSAAKPDEQLLEPAAKGLYMEVVGALLYLTNTTRPDLSYAVSVLARRCAQPCERHLSLLKGVVRYLAGTQQTGITYTRSTGSLCGGPLVGYCDSDYGGCSDTRRSRGGYVFFLCGGPVAWSSRMQTAVAKSTAEAEYMSAAAAASMAVLLKRTAHFLGAPKSSEPVHLQVDNQAAVFMVSNSAEHSRVKHIDMCHHFIKDVVARLLLRVSHVCTDLNVADVFTKALAGDKFTKFRSMLGLTG